VSDGKQPTRDQDPGSPVQRLLVVVAPNQNSDQLVRWTHRLARNSNCPWAAVYVEGLSLLPEAAQSQVTKALSLARELGAEVITATSTDGDEVRVLLRVALRRGVTQIVIGKPAGRSFRRLFRHDRLLRRLLQESGELDIHVVRFKDESPATAEAAHAKTPGSTLREYLLAVGMILAVACAGHYVEPVAGYHAVAWIFIAAVVIMAGFLGRGVTLLAATLSALLWDFLFEAPRYSFYIASVEDRILFVIYFAVAVVLGQLTAKIRVQEREERGRQERATALQLLTHETTEAANIEEMLRRAVQRTAAVFKAEIAIWLPSKPGLLRLHPASAFNVPEEENPVVTWVFEQGQWGGKFTANFPQATTLYNPLAAHGETTGVMGLRLSQPAPLATHQRILLDAFSQQIAAMIQRYQMQEVSQKSKVLAESERLSKTMLNSLSHEIRTPLAVIQSATTNMVEFSESEMSQTQKVMLRETMEATERLNRLVGKVLDMTRLESGNLKPKFDPCEVSELVDMALSQTGKELAQHQVTIEIAPDLPRIRVDFDLMLHSLNNLLSNAAFHTPAGTEVRLSAKVEDGALLFTVADRGPGIPPGSIPHLFEKFYRAPSARTGGTGLGLSLVKGFAQAHGGQVSAENRATGGAAFTIRLPLDKTLPAAEETPPLAQVRQYRSG
jgi:two-component system, OmpR family, sensor histidine kinase KdpD